MKEGEVADSKRGGRSDDDEFDNAELDEFDDDADELDDDEAYDDDSDDDVVDEDEDAPAASRARSRTAAKAAWSSAGTKVVARPKKKSKDDVGPGIIGRLIRFVREVVAELQKVIWPTRKELLTYTTVVVVFVTIVMTLVALLDLGFAKAMFGIFGGKTISSK
jgi:preprotein translocase subunit SecE